MSIIKTEHLTHIYSQGTPYERAALQDFNIEIEEGEFAGIIGHTGSGKSTFIQHLNGLLAPTEGKPAMYDTVENIFSRVEELTAMGLAVPQISRVFAGLRAAGYQVPGNIYTVEGAAAAILNAVKGGAAR